MGGRVPRASNTSRCRHQRWNNETEVQDPCPRKGGPKVRSQVRNSAGMGLACMANAFCRKSPEIAHENGYRHGKNWPLCIFASREASAFGFDTAATAKRGNEGPSRQCRVWKNGHALVHFANPVCTTGTYIVFPSGGPVDGGAYCTNIGFQSGLLLTQGCDNTDRAQNISLLRRRHSRDVHSTIYYPR
jgi:hypothetical protein